MRHSSARSQATRGDDGVPRDRGVAGEVQATVVGQIKLAAHQSQRGRIGAEGVRIGNGPQDTGVERGRARVAVVVGEGQRSGIVLGYVYRATVAVGDHSADDGAPRSRHYQRLRSRPGRTGEVTRNSQSSNKTIIGQRNGLRGAITAQNNRGIERLIIAHATVDCDGTTIIKRERLRVHCPTAECVSRSVRCIEDDLLDCDTAEINRVHRTADTIEGGSITRTGNGCVAPVCSIHPEHVRSAVPSCV